MIDHTLVRNGTARSSSLEIDPEIEERADWQAFVLERNGCRLHYWLTGPEDGPVVVLSHGAGMDHRSFVEQVPHVNGVFRLLLWDIRGHGLSKPMGHFTLEEAAADLLAILDHHGFQEVTLVGLSLGGYISQLVNYHHPERVKALFLTSCTLITERLSWPRRLKNRFFEWMLTVIPYAVVKAQAAFYVSTHSGVLPYVHDAMGRLTKREFRTVWQAIARTYIPDPDFRFQKPCQLAYGAYTKLKYMKPILEERAKLEERCNVKCIPGAGHNANQDNPEFYNEILENFLFRVYPYHIPIERLRSRDWY